MSTSLAEQACQYIQSKNPGFKPRLGIILGSGLGDFVQAMEQCTTISYQDIPGFPRTAVSGHDHLLTMGSIAKQPLVCLQGRAHLYENPSYDCMKTYIRCLKLLACEILILTNAAGSFHRAMTPGSLVLIKDHINLQPGNPLAGPNDDEFGPRFPPLDNAYDATLRTQLKDCASTLNISLPEGIYTAVQGPSFETTAEIAAFKRLGGDMVGMSTVPEVIIASHCGLRVAALSIITNYATGLATSSHDHNEVLQTAKLATTQLCDLLVRFIEQL